MSRDAFEAVIGKAAVEAEFRDLLLADPDQALAGFHLTEEEASILKRIDGETLETIHDSLDAFIRARACKKERVLEGKENQSRPQPSTSHKGKP